MVAQLPCESREPRAASAGLADAGQMPSMQRRGSSVTVLHRSRRLTCSPRPLKPSELNVLRAQYEKEGDMVGVQTKFNYAWVRSRFLCTSVRPARFSAPPPPPPSPLPGHLRRRHPPLTEERQGLVKSNNRGDQQLGVRLLSEIFRLSPERRRECLYYLALGNYKLANYGEARRYNDLLLDKEPANLQAADLRQLIDAKVAREGLVGVAILSAVGIAAGVVGIAAGVVGTFFLRNARRT